MKATKREHELCSHGGRVFFHVRMRDFKSAPATLRHMERLPRENIEIFSALSPLGFPASSIIHLRIELVHFTQDLSSRAETEAFPAVKAFPTQIRDECDLSIDPSAFKVKGMRFLFFSTITNADTAQTAIRVLRPKPRLGHTVLQRIFLRSRPQKLDDHPAKSFHLL